MKTLDIQVNVYYKIDNNILKYREIFNKELESSYLLAVIDTPLEEIDPSIINEVPLLFAKSNNEHSTIEVSNSKVKLNVRYDREYESDFTKCMIYLKEKIDDIFNILEQIPNIEFMFSGIYSTFLFDNKIDPVNWLKRGEIETTLSSVMQCGDVYDTSLKYTYVKDEQYFINIQLSNIRGTQQLSNSPDLVQKVNCLSVIVDINDRYAFNEVANYKSSKLVMEKNLEILDCFVKEKITDVII